MANITVQQGRDSLLLLKKELWKDIEEYNGQYKISNYGRVYTCEQLIKTKVGWIKRCPAKIMTLQTHKKGYIQINLKKDGATKRHLIHRLVGLHFIENNKGLPQINHKDGIKSNNNISNLEWVTDRENKEHSYRIGLQKERIKKMSIPIVQRTLGGRFIKRFNSQREAGRECGFSQANIWRGLKNGHPSYGFLWTYN